VWRAFTEHLPDVDALRIVREVFVEEHDTKRLTLRDGRGSREREREREESRASRGRVHRINAPSSTSYTSKPSTVSFLIGIVSSRPTSTWNKRSSPERSGLTLDESASSVS
jgi:hypothetical protein